LRRFVKEGRITLR